MDRIKAKNTEYLQSIGIEVPANLPSIEGLEEVNPRSAQDIAKRLCALSYIIVYGFGASRIEMQENLDEYSLTSYVSEYELRLRNSDSISDQDKINLTWLAEAAQSLAWCISLTEVDHFAHCDNDLAQKIPFKSNPDDFIETAILRPLSEIQYQSDLLYRMHWYARDCSLSGKDCKLSLSIISERRKAMDWAYGVEEDWDEIPMDT